MSSCHPPMLVHYRHRRGMYPLSPRPRVPRRLIIFVAFLLLVLFFFGRFLFSLFGFGSPIDNPPAVLSVEDRGIVSVVLEGGQSKTAENSMKLFQGEKLSTGPNAGASLTFFDGSVARLDENTDVTIDQSARAKESSKISLTLGRGSIWFLVPAYTASGALQHTVSTPILSYALPSNTEAIVSPSSLLVFTAESAGVTVSLPKHDAIVIGEGQRLILPPNVQTSALMQDLYTYRTPLDASTVHLNFLDDSRRLWKTGRSGTGSTLGTNTATELLTITQPTDGMQISTGTVHVQGTFATTVDTVKINGYPAVLDREQGVFSQEISLPDGAQQFDIRVQAFDPKQMPLAEVHRLVKRAATQSGSTALLAPTITSPAHAGDTYQTNKDELVLRGNAPTDAAAMYVNDYKLQLFTPEKGTWSYLASLKLGNMKPGLNTYDVIAENASGQKSPAARITILSGSGADGVVSTASSVSSTTTLNPATLPTNAPLTPGVLKVSGDAAQLGFVASGTGFLLEGTTSSDTATVWVNGYRLQLYKPGKTTWNYLASPDLKTLKEGKNAFSVVARDSKNQILDTLEISVEYKK